MSNAGTIEQPIRSGKDLSDAFELFNEMSNQLAESYRDLEHRIATLTGELEMVSKERLHELAEKESLANRLHSLLDLLPGGVVVLDGSGRVQECNPAAIALLGEPLHEQLWRTVIKREFAPRSDDGYEVSLKDGRRLRIATTALGEEPGQIILLTDLTETRELQERLNQHQRLSLMGKMSASLAHQVRTPLATAMLYASHLQGDEINEQQRKKFADKLQGRLQHLEQQVNEMLAFAKGGSSVAETICIDTLISEVEQSVESQVQESGTKLTITIDEYGLLIHGNKDSLIGAISNLVINGIQACEQTPAINITVKRQENTVVISVIDNGPGISQELQEKLFDAFFTTRSEGTGLGLAVVKAVVGAHGGDICVESTVGKGSKFVVTIPVIVKR